MPKCGSQCWLCDLPVRFDTYRGCSHGCKYCFVQTNGKKYDISKIKKGEGVQSLLNWINGKREQTTKWCDWDIPLHWGGVSDPFQPCERTMRRSYEALKVFAKTKYPFVVSTKGKIVADPKYLELLKQCNCVVQISAVCSKYDVLEPGAPTFLDRVEIMRKVAPNVKRVIVRIQPYMHEVREDVIGNLDLFKEAGIYGIIVEGMKFSKKLPGLVKAGMDYVYPQKLIRSDLVKIRDAAHKAGLAFYSGENRERELGDSLCCCGIDGLDGFVENKYNLNHIARGDMVEPTEKMQQIGTARCFVGLALNTVNGRRLNGESFQSELKNMCQNKKKYINSILGTNLR